MIDWLNFLFLLVLSLLLSIYFYIKSVGPATLEQKIGEKAYEKCAEYRKISGVFWLLGLIGYVVYIFYPLPVPLPAIFPLPYLAIVSIAIIILVPSVYLMRQGTKDAESRNHDSEERTVSLWWNL